MNDSSPPFLTSRAENAAYAAPYIQESFVPTTMSSPCDDNLTRTLEVLMGVESSITAERSSVITQGCEEGIVYWLALDRLVRKIEGMMWLASNASREASDLERTLVDHVLSGELSSTDIYETVERAEIIATYAAATAFLCETHMLMSESAILHKSLLEEERQQRVNMIGSELSARARIWESSLCACAEELDALDVKSFVLDESLTSLSKSLQSAVSNATAQQGIYGSLCSAASSLLVSPSSVR